MRFKLIHNSLLAVSVHRVFLIGIALGLGACTQEKLSQLETNFLPTPSPSGVQVNFCTDPAQVLQSKLKYVIVIDHSGSNAQNYKMDPTTGGPDLTNGLIISPIYGTDPTGYSRYGDITVPGTLLNFLHNTPSNNPANPSVYFASFTFNGSFAEWPSNQGFTSDVRGFEAQMTWQKSNLGDAGSTDYLDTLRAVQSLIQSDINAAQTCAAMSVGSPPTANCPTPGQAVSSSYVIVFMSDGAPIIDITLNPLVINRQLSTDILGTVAGIVGLQANSRFVDSINLFTIYYYQPSNPDNTAVKLLADMATAGNGLSYNITSGSNIDYRQFTPPSRLIKFSLADVFVTNASVVIGPDGSALPDTDMDGLDDATEAQLGSSSTLADTDGNGVKDIVENQLNATPCGAKNAKGLCVKGVGTINYATGLCSSIPHTNVKGNITFAASDPDGLNDCEKLLLQDPGGINNPDSNADLIPDWLQFKNGVPFQLGSVSATSSQDVNDISYYQKIKTSLPALTPYYQLLNPQPSQYDLTLLSSNANQDCYRLIVQNLPVSGNDNMVRVDVVLKSPLLQDRYLYRVGQKRFSGSSLALQFNDWNDPGEKAAGTWQVWP